MFRMSSYHWLYLKLIFMSETSRKAMASWVHILFKHANKPLCCVFIAQSPCLFRLVNDNKKSHFKTEMAF